MKNIVQLVFMSAACSIASAVAETAKFTALVLDDATGEPIANVRVNGGFDMNHGWLAVKGSPGPNNVKGVTDGKGRCELKGETNTGRVWFYVEDRLPSHYSKGAGASASFAEKNGIGLWQPENLVLTARLQRIKCPVPLAVRKVVLDVGQEIVNINRGKFAFDFLKSDWLPPHGTGTVADIEFTRLPHQDLGAGEIDGITGNAFRETVAIHFPGEGNGIVEVPPPFPRCLLKIRSAPENGYAKDGECWLGVDRNLRPEKSARENRNFCFRIRECRDEAGNVVEAYYGKIYGDFRLVAHGASGIRGIQFTYYLNPTSLDRNLEYDRINNLDPNADIDGQFEP